MLEKYNEIYDNVSDSMKKGFHSEPICAEKYLKTKKNLTKGKINKNVHGDKVPKAGSQCICLSVIFIDFVFRTSKNCYPFPTTKATFHPLSPSHVY